MRIPTLFAVLVTTALVAGCGGTTGGTPTTAATTTATSTSASSGSSGGGTTENGAPKVKTPVDFAKSEANPCGILTAAQVQSLGMGAVVGKDDSGAAGKSCGWSDGSGPSGQTVFFTFVPGDGGLDFLYGNKASYGLFEPLPEIQGQPAVLVSSTDVRARGNCGLAVGLTDTQHMLTSVTIRGGSTPPSPRYSDPCGVAKEATDLALVTIKGGS